MRILRIAFSKTGEAAYISHLDLQRVFARGLRISGLPVWYSQGFNPHIYMSFALPLPLGCESVCEFVDVRTEAENEDFTPYVDKLSAALPRGIEVAAIRAPVQGPEAIKNALYRFSWAEKVLVYKAIEGYNALGEAMVMRKTKRSEQQVDLKEVLPALKPCDGDGAAFEALLPAGGTLNYSPALLAGFLDERFGLPQAGVRLRRLRILAQDGTDFM